MKKTKTENGRPTGASSSPPERCLPLLAPRIAPSWTAAFLVILLAWATAARAQDYAIIWWSTDGGGGTSASADGRFSLGGTIGQPDAGTLTADPFNLFGGFWQPDDPAPCDCRLAIRRSGSGLVLTWPACCGHCVLESATELRNLPPDWKPGDPSPTEWHVVTPPPTGNTYTVPVSEAPRFFRLRCP